MKESITEPNKRLSQNPRRGFTVAGNSPKIGHRSTRRYLINETLIMGKGEAVKVKPFFNQLYPGLISILTRDIPLNMHLDVPSPSDRQDQSNAVLKAINEGDPFFYVTWIGEGRPTVIIDPVEMSGFLAVIVVSRKKWHYFFPGVPCITQLVHELLLSELLPELVEVLDCEGDLLD